MLFPFNLQSDAAQMDPEKKRRFLQERMLNADNPVLGTTEMLLGMANAIPQQQPERATVSGSSVIGMTPEQTTALLDRVARQNQFEAGINQQEKARQDRKIEGFGERVFRARELQQQRELRQREREDDRAYQQEQQSEQRLYEQNRWAEQQAMGQVQTKPDGSQVRIWRDPETGEMMQEDFAPRQPKGGFQTVLGEDGNPVRKWMQEGEQAPAYVRGGAPGAGGATSPTQAAYAIAELRRQGLSLEQIGQRFPQLASFVQGIDSSAPDPAFDKEKRAFIARYIQNQVGVEPQEAIQQAEQIWGAMNGTPIPPRPIAQMAAELGAGDKGVKGREKLGMALLQQGYPLPDIVQYLNTAGVVDNIAWGRDNTADPAQWGNDQAAQAPQAQPVAPVQPQVNSVPWTVGGAQQPPAPAQPIDQNAAAMMGTMGGKGVGTFGTYKDPATGAVIKGTMLPDGTFVPEQ